MFYYIYVKFNTKYLLVATFRKSIGESKNWVEEIEEYFKYYGYKTRQK